MNELERRYLKENHFLKNPDGSYSANLIVGHEFCYRDRPDTSFRDEKQIKFLETQFGDKLNDVRTMIITIKHIQMSEFDVKLEWQTDVKNKNNEGEWYEHDSSITGEGLYELISQAIVLADVNEFNRWDEI